MRPSSPLPFTLSGPTLVLAAAMGAIVNQPASGGGIVEFERNATAWKVASPCYQPFTFDQFYEGIVGATGCLLDSPARPVTLQLAGGTVTVSANTSGVPICAIHDGSTPSAVSDGALTNNLSTFVMEFDPPVTAFYTYYGSMAIGTTGTMKLYSGGGAVLESTITSAPSPAAAQATGHGFVSDTPIDRIEITTTDTGGTLVGAFVGLFTGEPSLGTNTISGYSGPAGATVQFDFACQFDVAPMVQNVSQGTMHSCIREAIAAAVNGDVIVTPPGLYREQINYSGKSITVRSIDPADPEVVQDTIVSSDEIDGSVVTFDSGEGAGATLSGLTIQGGNGTLISGQRRGGGILVSSASPTITACRIYDNSAARAGGCLVTSGSSPAFTDCAFEGNGATANGGALYLEPGSGPAIIDCTFTGNGAQFGGAIEARTALGSIAGCQFTGNTASIQGGGLYANTGVPTITGCGFSDNASGGKGAAIYCVATGFLTLHDMVFTSNNAGSDGGAVYGDANAQFEIDGCTFLENTGARGAAVFVSGPSEPPQGVAGGTTEQVIRSCKFLGNASSDTGAGGSGSGTLYLKSTSAATAQAAVYQCLFSGNGGTAFVADGGSASADVTNCTFSRNGLAVHAATAAHVQLKNCILWDGSVPEVTESLEGQVLWTHCDVYGTGGASGQAPNMDVNPLFIDLDGADNLIGTLDDDLRLTAGSPCIDAGITVAVLVPVDFDLDGAPRFNGPIDLGAFEFPVDCDGSGQPDYIEIERGSLPDCNENHANDECEGLIDCNVNGTLDMCEIDANPGLDGNDNGFLDSCEAPATISGTVAWQVATRPVVILPVDSTVSGSLSINAGVTVILAPGARLTINSGASLNVLGADGNPVRFTSSEVFPQAGDWEYISYSSGSSGSIHHAIIEFGQSYGVRVQSASVSIEDSLIQFVAGIDRPHGTATAPAQTGGDAYGIFVTGSVTPTIARNTIASIRGGIGGEGAAGAPGDSGGYGESGWLTGGDGDDGEDGEDGTPGAPGADGGDAYGLYCGAGVNATLVNNIIHIIEGGPGGRGGDGGPGGNGGNGGDGRSWSLSPLDFGGYDGGHAGAPGKGGAGGPGGDGGDATGLRLENALTPAVTQNMAVDIEGGAGGAGGDGGRGGNGGDGGTGGNSLPPFGGGLGGAGSVAACCSCTTTTSTGGDGGAAGLGRGIVASSTSASSVTVRQVTVAGLRSAAGGLGGAVGASGQGGADGDNGWGWLFIDVVEFVPVFIPWHVETTIIHACPTVLCPCDSIPGSNGSITGASASGSAQLNVANCIFDGDGSAQSTGVSKSGTGAITISFSLLHGFQTATSGTVTQGAGMLIGSPLFVSASSGDFHLGADSPAIDAGSNALVPAGLTFDIDGDDRIFDGDDDGSAIVDLGADEFNGVFLPADLNGDGVVNTLDLGIMLAAWSIPATAPGCGGSLPCPADLNGDGFVNTLDLGTLLASWTL